MGYEMEMGCRNGNGNRSKNGYGCEYGNEVGMVGMMGMMGDNAMKM
jgi:hypothetical protein